MRTSHIEINGVRYIGSPYLAYGDYLGTEVERSNVRVILDETPADRVVDLPTAAGGHAWTVTEEYYTHPWGDFRPMLQAVARPVGRTWGEETGGAWNRFLPLPRNAPRRVRRCRPVVGLFGRPSVPSVRYGVAHLPTVIRVRYDYGGIALFLRPGDPRLARLEDYPILDEDDCGTLADEMTWDQWVDYGRNDAVRAALKCIPDGEDPDMWEPVIRARLEDYEDVFPDYGPEIETGGNVWFDLDRRIPDWWREYGGEIAAAVRGDT